MKKSFNKTSKKRNGKLFACLLAGAALATVFHFSDQVKTDAPIEKIIHIIDAEDIALIPGPTLLINTSPDEYEALMAGPNFIRFFNDNEKELAQSIFGDTIDLENIKLVHYNYSGEELESNVLTGDTRYIRFYSEQALSSDYSNDDRAELFGKFIYHLTEIWQHQNNWEFTSNIDDEEGYSVGSDAKLIEYGPTTQAMILEDYARRFLHQDYRTKRGYSAFGGDVYTKTNCTADDNIVSIVEGQFPNAKQARLDHLKTRFLTSNELQFVSTFFNGAVDPSLIKNNLFPQFCSENYQITLATVNGGDQTDINYWGPSYHSDDYTQDSSMNFGIFAHELVHIWQNQTDDAHTNEQFINTPNTYDYPINNESFSFENYSTEQQGAIIEDYIRYYLHKEKTTTRLEKTPKNLEGLKILVENYFPRAKEMRETFEKTGNLFPKAIINPFKPIAIKQNNI